MLCCAVGQYRQEIGRNLVQRAYPLETNFSWLTSARCVVIRPFDNASRIVAIQRLDQYIPIMLALVLLEDCQYLSSTKGHSINNVKAPAVNIWESLINVYPTKSSRCREVLRLLTHDNGSVHL